MLKFTQLFLIGFLSLLSISLKAQSGTVTFSTGNRTNIGTTISDGKYYSNDIPGIQLDIFAAMNSTDAKNRTSSGSFVYFDVNTEGMIMSKNFIAPIDITSGSYTVNDADLPRLVVIKSSDGSEFNFKSIYVADYIGGDSPIKFEGFRNGNSTGSVELVINQGTYEEIFTSTQLTPSIFQNVDEVRISNMVQYEFAWGIYAGLNDIVIDAPVVPAPTVSSVTVPTNKTYKIGDALNFTVNYDQNVTVTGTPQLPITLDTGGTVNASYVSGSGTSALNFSYTVVSGNLDADGITVGSSLSLNGGRIKNGTTDAELTLNSVPATTGVKVDGVLPTATISLSDAALKSGETSTVTFTFSEAVTGFTYADITIAYGMLSNLATADGGITWTATFTPTSSVTDATNEIVLDQSGVSDNAGNAGSGSANSSNYVIDTQNPSVTIASTAANPTNLTTLPVTVTFSETVTGFVAADVTVTNGTIGSFTGSGTTYSFNVTPLAQGTVTVAIAASVAQDAAGNNNAAATSLTRTFDAIAPAVSGVTNGGSYTSAVTPNFTEGTATLSKNGATAVAYTSNTAISTTGNYTLVVTDAAGNNNTVTFTISIATATEEKSATAILLYPNPCNEGFHINIGEEDVKLTITDLAGRQVLEQMVNGNDYIATSKLKAGIYIVKAGTFVTRLRVK